MREKLDELVGRHLKKGFTDIQRRAVVEFMMKTGDLLVVIMAKEFNYKIIETIERKDNKRGHSK